MAAVIIGAALVVIVLRAHGIRRGERRRAQFRKSAQQRAKARKYQLLQ